MSENYPVRDERRSGIERLIGGRPSAVAVRLVLLSLVVGFLMTLFGVDVQDLVSGAIELVETAIRDGFGAFGSVGGYILTGAAVVLPIWLLMRLLKAR